MTKKVVPLEIQLEHLLDNGVDLKGRTVYVLDGEDGEIDYGSIVKGINYFASLGEEDINLFINCSGGDVYKALSVADLVMNIPNKVTGILYGLAASGASLIFISCDVRVMSTNSFLMLHEVQDEVEGSYKTIKDEMEHNKDIMKSFYSIYENHSKKTKRFWKSKLEKDFYISSDRALTLGLTDGIVAPKLQNSGGR